MQPKQMQQHQMQQKQMTVRQMANPQFTRQHQEHQHSMSIANPQRDSRNMQIPSGTFEEDSISGFKFTGLPFRWLRTWIFSLLALLALPIGLMLIYVGTSLQESGVAWTEVTAEVSRYNADENMRYQYENAAGARVRGEFNFKLENFLAINGDQASLSLSTCDLVSRFTIPSEEDATFSIWVNPDDASQVSCLPVSADTGAVMILLGWALVILSAIRLLRTINDAARRPA